MGVANRTLERGEKLAGRFGAEALRLADLPQRLAEFDVVVSCTASSLPIIGLGAVERALKARKHRPMFMVDLAVPRDIEPEVNFLANVYLYNVDDLQAIADMHLAALVVARLRLHVDERFILLIDQGGGRHRDMQLLARHRHGGGGEHTGPQ